MHRAAQPRADVMAHKLLVPSASLVVAMALVVEPACTLRKSAELAPGSVGAFSQSGPQHLAKPPWIGRRPIWALPVGREALALSLTCLQRQDIEAGSGCPEGSELALEPVDVTRAQEAEQQLKAAGPASLGTLQPTGSVLEPELDGCLPLPATFQPHFVALWKAAQLDWARRSPRGREH